MSPHRRHRQPPAANSLVILLAGVLGVALVFFVVASILAFTQISGAVDQINTNRREAAIVSCRNTESLKTGLRLVLRTFHVNPAQLPVDDHIGRRPLDPIPGGCPAYADRLVHAAEPNLLHP